MTQKKLLLITGATGKQGGATIRHLLKDGAFELRAMTRNPESEAAQGLAQQGVQVVQGDLDDEASIDKALAGAWGVFGVQNTWEAGVAKEEEQGIRLVNRAKKAGVQHFVYTSVGSAHQKTGIPHFDNKWRVEEALRAAEFPSHVILRPVSFLENLPSPMALQGDKLVFGMKPDTKLQMVAVDDIGRFGAAAFKNAKEWNRAEIELAGDSITMQEAAVLLSEGLGQAITFQELPIAAVRGFSEDMALMLEWFERTGYSADIPSLESKWGIRPTSASEWARRLRR
jgi:uncharacterized protein YbjT (DUF2867 family)